MSRNPQREFECECDDCGWHGPSKETNKNGDCPDCGGETFKVEEDECVAPS